MQCGQPKLDGALWITIHNRQRCFDKCIRIDIAFSVRRTLCV